MIAALPFPSIDPILVSFEIAGREFAVHWYAVAYILGFILAWRWIVWLIKRPALWADGKPPMEPKQVEDLLTWMIVGTILGGRVGYVLFYNFQSFVAEPLSIIRIWEGGMSFHGGFLGVIVAGVLFCRKNGINAWSAGDAIASGAPFGLFLGRLANFINAELWGRPTDVPWAFVFPGETAQNCAPIVTEICARHPSQLYEALAEGIILFVVMAILILRKNWLHKSGKIIGLFFLGYGLARTIIEGFRQGDAQFVSINNPWGQILRFGNDADAIGLTMGQLLSMPMIIIGLGLLLYRQKIQR